MTQFYVDVSHHDRNRRGGPLDWSAIRRYTAPVMVARATYGDPSGWHRSSSYHAEFHNGAKAAGFDVRGSYHNLVKGDAASIARQVDWLRREMDAVGAVWAMLDVERYPELVSADMWPRWDDVQQFCDRWHTVDDRVLTAYIPGWLYNGYYAGKDVKALRVPLVESDYGSNPGGLPAAGYAVRGGDTGRGWQSTGNLAPSVWQFSSNCDMPGASGQTDINAFRGSLAELRALLTGQSQEDDMPLTTAEIDAIALRVWTWDLQNRDGVDEAYRVLNRAAAAATVAATRADLDATEVQAIAAALAPAIVAQLPESGAVTDEQLEAALRKVLGSVDNAPQS